MTPSLARTRVQVNFLPGRPISEREQEVLQRVMERAAREQIERWDEIDQAAAVTERRQG